MSSVNDDISDFLYKVDSLRPEDRRALLTLLVNKHIVTSGANLVINYEDLEQIMMNARNIYVATPAPMRLANRKNDSVELSATQFNQFCMVEAVIGFLNSKEALKRFPEFKRGKK